MNNPLSYSSLKLDLFSRDGGRLKSTSGFVVEVGKKYYLITNWHVISGREMTANQPKESIPTPHLLKTTLHMQGGLGEQPAQFFMGLRKRITIPLYDDNDAPRWVEHRRNQENQPTIDIVALPIQFDRTLRLFSGNLPGINIDTSPWSRETRYWTKMSAVPLSAIDTDVEYSPPDAVHIIGYPHGWAPEGADKSSSAFWRTGFIASEIHEVGTTRSNTFYVDPCAPEGMTGSPVVGFKNDRLKLLGVYSDRSTAESGANAGLVWDAWLLKELIEPA